MSDIDIRTAGRAGRITLTRPKALNALSYDMCMAIDTALRHWREDDSVDLVILDAEGDKAFCAGGDIAELYATGTAGDYAFGQRFWRDEYRMNAQIADYPKPVVSFMQGFTMGGGVGIGCHGTHRVVCDSSRVSMPEVGIGLIPDVGGSGLLARAPGRLGEYLGLTAARMGADDAILAGFADHYVPQEQWGDLIELLEASGDVAHVGRHARPAPQGALRVQQGEIDRLFAAQTLSGIVATLRDDGEEFSAGILKTIARNSPLSMACTIEMLRRLRATEASIPAALELEYRFTYRAMEHGDLLEGIRAQIIDKDRSPIWRHADMTVPAETVDAMLRPLDGNTLIFEEE